MEQVKEAAEFLLTGNYGRRHSTPPIRLLLVGYSYGSIIAASASASIPQVVGVASIAPPIGVRHWLFLFSGNYHLEQARKRLDLPHLFVIGDQDNFTSETAFMDVVKSMRQETTTGALLKDADHFFRGREKDLMDILGTWHAMATSISILLEQCSERIKWTHLALLPGHWILNVFPQCDGDLKALADAQFPLYDVPSESMNSEQDMGACAAACGPGDM